jgi:hypothetical protein
MSARIWSGKKFSQKVPWDQKMQLPPCSLLPVIVVCGKMELCYVVSIISIVSYMQLLIFVMWLTCNIIIFYREMLHYVAVIVLWNNNIWCLQCHSTNECRPLPLSPPLILLVVDNNSSTLDSSLLLHPPHPLPLPVVGECSSSSRRTRGNTGARG